MMMRLFLLVFLGMFLLSGCQTPPFGNYFSKKADIGNDKASSVAGKETTSGGGPTTSSEPWRDLGGANPPHIPHGGVDVAAQAAARGSSFLASATAEPVNDNLIRGHREAEAGRFDEAKRYYRMVLEQQPDHPIAHHKLAIIADMQNNFRAAEYHYQTALRSKTNDPDILSDLGWSYILQGKYHDSEEILLSALVYDPRHRRALDRLGYLYGQQGDYDRAREMFARGSSQAEAEKKLATLFPGGRPAGGNVPQLAQGQNPASQPATGSAAQAGRFQTWPTVTPGGSAGGPPANWPSGSVPTQAATWPNEGRSAHQTAPGGDYAAFPGPAVVPSGSAQQGLAPGLAASSAPIGHAGGSIAAGAQQPVEQAAGYRFSTEGNPNTAAPNPLDAMPYFPTISPGSGMGAQSASQVQHSAAESPDNWPTSGHLQPAGFENPALGVQSWPHAPQNQFLPGESQAAGTIESGRRFSLNSAPQQTNGFATGFAGQSETQQQAAIHGMNAGPGQLFPVAQPNSSADRSGQYRATYPSASSPHATQGTAGSVQPWPTDGGDPFAAGAASPSGFPQGPPPNSSNPTPMPNNNSLPIWPGRSSGATTPSGPAGAPAIWPGTGNRTQPSDFRGPQAMNAPAAEGQFNGSWSPPPAAGNWGVGAAYQPPASSYTSQQPQRQAPMNPGSAPQSGFGPWPGNTAGSGSYYAAPSSGTPSYSTPEQYQRPTVEPNRYR